MTIAEAEVRRKKYQKKWSRSRASLGFALSNQRKVVLMSLLVVERAEL